MADTPEAAPSAPTVGTEETPNTTPQTTETATPEAAPQGEAPQDNYGFTSDQLKELSSFIKGQGGYDKAFPAWKDSISKPQSAPEAKAPETPAQPTQPVEPAQPQRQQGYLSPSDIAALQYRQMLASEEKYKDIKDYITGKGESKTNFLEEMKLFGMNPVDANGNLNDAQIRRFLDLKAAAAPATQTTAPVTTTPTVEYVSVGDTISSIDDAYKVIQQNMALAASGRAEHPKTEEAKKFIKDHFAAKHNVGKR